MIIEKTLRLPIVERARERVEDAMAYGVLIATYAFIGAVAAGFVHGV